jgi:CBS domain containing-hemolysin-like protein
VIALVKLLLLPLTLPLRLVTRVLESLLGLDSHELARVQGREAVLDLLREGEARTTPEVESMMRNILELRSVRLERVMVPWRRVEVLHADQPEPTQIDGLGRSAYTRLPVVGAKGTVKGYVHQLEVLAADRATPLERHLRPMIALDPTMPLDRALARLRQTGQRAALVGSPTVPLGLVTLKDLVEEISGELHRW